MKSFFVFTKRIIEFSFTSLLIIFLNTFCFSQDTLVSKTKKVFDIIIISDSFCFVFAYALSNRPIAIISLRGKENLQIQEFETGFMLSYDEISPKFWKKKEDVFCFDVHNGVFYRKLHK